MRAEQRTRLLTRCCTVGALLTVLAGVSLGQDQGIAYRVLGLRGQWKVGEPGTLLKVGDGLQASAQVQALNAQETDFLRLVSTADSTLNVIECKDATLTVCRALSPVGEIKAQKQFSLAKLFQPYLSALAILVGTRTADAERSYVPQLARSDGGDVLIEDVAAVNESAANLLERELPGLANGEYQLKVDDGQVQAAARMLPVTFAAGTARMGPAFARQGVYRVEVLDEREKKVAVMTLLVVPAGGQEAYSGMVNDAREKLLAALGAEHAMHEALAELLLQMRATLPGSASAGGAHAN